MEQVFISYSRKDLGFVRRLAADLQAAGFKVWYDLSGLEAGTRWGKEIQNALRLSRFFLVVLSPNSCESEWVEREFLYASNQKLKIIPLLYHPCDLPLWSLNLHFMELQEENYQSNLPELLKIMGVEAKLEEEVSPPAMGLPASLPEKEEPPPQVISLDEPAAESSAQPSKQEEALAGIEQAVSGEGGKNKKQRTKEKRPETKSIPEAIPSQKTRKKKTWLPWAAGLGGLAVISTMIIILALTAKTDPATLPPTPTFTPEHTAAPPPTATAFPTAKMSITSPVDGMTMIHVPAGSFRMGNLLNYDTQPIHTVTLDAFWIDKTEVTVGMYHLCVQAGICQPPSEVGSTIRHAYYTDPEFNEYPVVYMTWEMADTYCTWAGRRLPTSAEWEKAARGSGGRAYPWGEGVEFDCLLANFDGCVGDTAPVGSYPDGAGPYGALDMAGNAWEWVSDWYQADYYQTLEDGVFDPRGPSVGVYRFLRGASFADTYDTFGYLYWFDPTEIGRANSFRCASSAAP